MTSIYAAADARENRAAGILWMLATMVCFIGLDSLMKHLMQTYPLVQVTWARFFFATLAALVFAAPRLREVAASRAPGLQLVRSILLVSTTGAFNAGIRTVPLATATTIMFLSPLLVTVLSIPLLREHVAPRLWLGVGVGFIGALVVVQPWEGGLGALGGGVAFLLLAAFLNANYQILTRKVRHDDPLTSLLYTALAGAIITSLLLPWFWVAPDLSGWLLFAAAGLAGCLGHLCLIQAFQRAPASVVAPYSYTSLLWAALFGLMFFGEWPDGWTWAGAALIVGGGLYIFQRERQADENR